MSCKDSSGCSAASLPGSQYCAKHSGLRLSFPSENSNGTHNEKGEFISCAIDCGCAPGVLSDWFSIVLAATWQEVAFCPRHALAAEALSGIGLPCEQVVARIKTLALQRRRDGKGL